MKKEKVNFLIGLLLIAISGIFTSLNHIQGLTVFISQIFNIIDWTALVIGAIMTSWFRENVNINWPKNLIYIISTYLLFYFLTYYSLKF